MAKDKLSKSDASLIAEALERHQAGLNYDSENRELAREDMEFAAGEQWLDAVKSEREQQKRIMVTENRLHVFVQQVMGGIRRNRPSLRVRGVDDGADKETAEILTGMFRNIENNSLSRQPYIRAAETAVISGIGHFRIITEYRSPDSFDQDILMEPIIDPFAVIWDPNAKLITREDAMWCLVMQKMTKEAYKAKYPDAPSVDSFPEDVPVSDYSNEWVSDDKVAVAEYWCKKPVTKTLGLKLDGSVEEAQEGADYLETRERKTYEVYRYVISANHVLEEKKQWPVPYIPIIPVMGAEIQREGKTTRFGIVRYAKEAQRRLNYWLTAQTEYIALQPKAPWLATPKMVKGHVTQWKNANKTTDSTLLYNPDPEAPGGRPMREAPPTSSMALYNEIGLAVDALKATTGIFDASLGSSGNETSGVAINARQEQAETGTFLYVDNLARAVEYAGRQVVKLMPKIYDSERAARILGEDGTEQVKTINRAVIENNESRVEYDLSAGEYDVVVTTGPSFTTKRQEAAQGMLQFMQTNPQAASVAGDLFAEAMDWPGADKFAARLKKILPPGVAEIDEDDPEEKEKAAMQMQQAQQVQQMQSMDFELEMARKQAELVKLKAEINKTQADTGETLASARNKIADAVLKELEARMKSGALGQAMQMALDAQPGGVYIEN